MTLRVTLEIIPFGVESRKRTIGIIEINNLARKTKAGLTCYQARYWDEGKAPMDEPEEWGFTHKRDEGALVCVKKAMRSRPRASRANITDAVLSG